MSTDLPAGFRAYVANIGIKDDTDDLVIVAADQPCAAAAVFTKSSFAGPSVLVSRDHIGNGRAQAVVVISKNANVWSVDGHVTLDSRCLRVPSFVTPGSHRRSHASIPAIIRQVHDNRRRGRAHHHPLERKVP